MISIRVSGKDFPQSEWGITSLSLNHLCHIFPIPHSKRREMSTLRGDGKARWLIFYEPDMLSLVTASLLIRDVMKMKGVECTLSHLSRTEEWSKSGKGRKESDPYYEKIVVLGSISHVHGRLIAESYDDSTVALVVSKKIEGTPGNITQHVGAGEDVYEAVVSITECDVVKLSALSLLLSRRTGKQFYEEGEHLKAGISENKGKNLEEKIMEVVGKTSLSDVLSTGKEIYEKNLAEVEKRVRVGKVLKIAVVGSDGKEKDVTAWMFETEKNIMESLRFSIKNVRTDLHLCKYTKGDLDRTFFTLMSSTDIDVGEVATTLGGGGNSSCGGWNMKNDLAKAWIESVIDVERVVSKPEKEGRAGKETE